jgi:hypothetical protein
MPIFTEWRLRGNLQAVLPLALVLAVGDGVAVKGTDNRNLNKGTDNRN